MRAAAAGRAGARRRHLDGDRRRRDGGRRGRGQHLRGRRRARGLGLHGARLASRAARARGGAPRRQASKDLTYRPSCGGPGGSLLGLGRAHRVGLRPSHHVRVHEHHSRACRRRSVAPEPRAPALRSAPQARLAPCTVCKRGRVRARLHGRVCLLLRRRLRRCARARALRRRRLLQLPPLRAAGARSPMRPCHGHAPRLGRAPPLAIKHTSFRQRNARVWLQRAAALCGWLPVPGRRAGCAGMAALAGAGARARLGARVDHGLAQLGDVRLQLRVQRAQRRQVGRRQAPPDLLAPDLPPGPPRTL
jgi:hypothetical protein